MSVVESQMSSVEFTYDPRKTANQKGDRSLTIPPARSAVCVEKSRDTGSLVENSPQITVLASFLKPH